MTGLGTAEAERLKDGLYCSAECCLIIRTMNRARVLKSYCELSTVLSVPSRRHHSLMGNRHCPQRSPIRSARHVKLQECLQADELIEVEILLALKYPASSVTRGLRHSTEY